MGLISRRVARTTFGQSSTGYAFEPIGADAALQHLHPAKRETGPMTTITYPSGNTSTFVIGALVGALAMLILAATLAFASFSAPAMITQPEAAPAPAINQWITSPISGPMEYAP
jgi:hypothetical protein